MRPPPSALPADVTAARAVGRLRTMAIVGALLAGGGMAACGESGEDQALAEVCDARADVEQQIDELQSLTLTTATVEQVRGNLDAIQADLQQMTESVGGLAEDTRAQVEEATDEFQSSLDAALSGLGQTKSLQAGRTELGGAIDDLASSYQEAFEPIECS